MQVTDLHGTPFADTYGQVLRDYLQTRREDALYRASLLSQTFVERGVGPEEIIALHFEQLDQALDGLSYRVQARSIGDAHQFLLEVMITYGVHYKEYLELRMREGVQAAEAEAELERRLRQERERIDQERTELLEHIAHELRTPITTALGTLDLARRSIARGNFHRLEPLIGTAREAVDRLSRLSAQLVQISHGKLPDLERKPQDISALLTQACAWAEASAVEKQLQFQCGPFNEHVYVIGDADALLSLFGNLLSNAIRYTPVGGTVSMTCHVEGETVFIECRDTGIGMSHDVQARIFERFFRAPEARNVDAQGLGVGLSLVHALVQAHDGAISVSSVTGEGSVFGVTLPVMREGDGHGAELAFDEMSESTEETTN
ncbi:MAG TPA: ATP-binding protein [Thermomicrobiales bacterium]|nr:ATP-binding protein [Thermomicrobiales bacterium]